MKKKNGKKWSRLFLKKKNKGIQKQKGKPNIKKILGQIVGALGLILSIGGSIVFPIGAILFNPITWIIGVAAIALGVILLFLFETLVGGEFFKLMIGYVIVLGIGIILLIVGLILGIMSLWLGGLVILLTFIAILIGIMISLFLN